MIAVYIVVQIMVAAGAISSLMQGLLVPMCTYSIVAIGLNLCVGYLGELSIGHAGFMCVGAFSSAFCTKMLEGCLLYTSEPDFFALAYYLGHENRGSLREMENAQRNSYLVDYCGERFWNRFLELCRRAEAEQMVRFMTRKYIYNTEESPSNS